MNRTKRLVVGGAFVALILMTMLSAAAETNTPTRPDAGAVRITNAPTENLPVGIDPKQTSDDPTYGYTKENSVKLGDPEESGGPAMSRVYLRHLRDGQFKPFTFERNGSVGAGPDGHIVDRYTLIDSAGKKYQIYIDMYHPENTPLKCKAPMEMYFWK